MVIRRGLLVLILLLALLSTQISLKALMDAKGVKVIVTFPYMLEDVRSLLCEGDEVESLAPLGVDPHEYQLKPDDVDRLSRANIIVSTAHTSFEIRIRELVQQGEIRAVLIEITDIENLSLLINPSTGQANLHGVLLHGDNYIRFVRHLSEILATVRPECSSIYRDRVRQIENRIAVLSSDKPLQGFKAVIDVPVLQYVSVWLGADVEAILMAEHEVPVMPQDIARVEDTLKKYRDRAIIVALEGSPALDLLQSFSLKYSAKMVILPNPITSSNSIIRYLEEVKSIVKSPQTIIETEPMFGLSHVAVVLIALALIATLMILWIRVRRWIDP